MTGVTHGRPPWRGWEGGTPTQLSISGPGTRENTPEFARGRARSSTSQARIEHTEIERGCNCLNLNELFWRRGWDSACCWVLKTKNLREFTFLTIR